jgi:hypothetical protein
MATLWELEYRFEKVIANFSCMISWLMLTMNAEAT